jgi:hypothetical protein
LIGYVQCEECPVCKRGRVASPCLKTSPTLLLFSLQRHLHSKSNCREIFQHVRPRVQRIYRTCARQHIKTHTSLIIQRPRRLGRPHEREEHQFPSTISRMLLQRHSNTRHPSPTSKPNAPLHAHSIHESSNAHTSVQPSSWYTSSGF